MTNLLQLIALKFHAETAENLRMKSDAISPKNELLSLAATVPSQPKRIEEQEILLSIDKASNQSQRSIRELLFQTAISKLEKEILRSILNYRAETFLPYSSENQTYTATKERSLLGNKIQVGKESTEILLANYKNYSSSSNQENNLAFKILSLITNPTNENATDKQIDPKQVLLELLANTSTDDSALEADHSEIANDVRKQNLISPELRRTILQSIEAPSETDKILFEGFLERRNEIIDIKRTITTIISNLELNSKNLEIFNQKSRDDINNLIPKYLMLLLPNLAIQFSEIERQLSDKEIRLLLSSLNINDNNPNSFNVASVSPEAKLIPTLLIDEVLKNIAEICELKTTHTANAELEREDEISSKEILKGLIFKNYDLNTLIKQIAPNIDKQISSLIPDNSLPLASEIESLLIDLCYGLSPDDKATRNTEIIELSDPTLFSRKIIAQTETLKDLLNKLDLATRAFTISNIPTSLSSEDLADISLNSLRLAIEVKSPELFRSSSQFLRLGLSNKDVISSIAILLIPIFDLISKGSENEPSIIKNEINIINEQLENLKLLNNKLNPKRKEVLLQVIESGTRIANSAKQLSTENIKATHERLLLEALSKESFSKLNVLAEKISQPSFLALGLPLPKQSFLEIKSTLHNPKVDEENDKGKMRNKNSISSEKIECSMLLPNLGECGIELTIFENQINLNICNQNQEIINTASEILTQLNLRLKDLDFHEPRVELICSQPKAVKPEWLWELLGLDN